MIELEYENDLLVVDEIIYDPSYETSYILKINNNYYRASASRLQHPQISGKKIVESDLQPYRKKIDDSWMRLDDDHDYLFNGMIPRGGFKVSAGRSITKEELQEIINKYKLTSNDITDEFESKIGSIYGDYAETIKALQLKLSNSDAISLNSELNEKGIQSTNGSPGRVDIRTDWGGKRSGSGRKASGRKLARIYVTEEEEQKLREYLEELRKNDDK